MKKLILLLFCFLCTGIFLSAASLDKYRGYDYLICKDSTYVDVESTGLGYFYIYQKVEILSPRGALRWRVLKYDYDPLTAAAQFTSVQIIRKDGRVEEVDLGKEQDYPAPARAIYWGARQKMIEIGRLEPGDVVTYSIFKKGFTYALLEGEGNGAGNSGGHGADAADDDRYIPPMRGQFYDIVPFFADQPIHHKVYSVNLPADKDLQYEFYQGECSVAVRNNGDKRLYTFAKKEIMPTPMEPGRVDLFDCAPKLFMSTAKDWEAKSLWFYKVNEDYGSFAPMPEAQAKVNSLLKKARTEIDSVSILTHWVADNMRYSGISMGEGEGFTLHNTAMNYTDRCGVCKDKAALLISLLRMAGFEAYPAMTMAGSRIESIPADHFNHSVAVVKLSDGKYHLLDPTWVPFIRELWSSAEQQQNYLMGVPEGAGLMLTPVSPPEDHYVRLQVQSALDAKGNLKGEFTITAEGQSDNALRRPFTGGFISEWRNAMERELLAVSPNARLISVDWGKNPKDYVAGPISIRMQFEIPAYAIASGKELICAPLSAQLYRGVKTYFRLGTQPERQFDFKDACSRLVELKETMMLPGGFQLAQNIAPESVQHEVADYSYSVRQEGLLLHFSHSLALKKRVYTAQDWPAFRKAVQSQAQFDQPFIFVAK